MCGVHELKLPWQQRIFNGSILTPLLAHTRERLMARTEGNECCAEGSQGYFILFKKFQNWNSCIIRFDSMNKFEIIKNITLWLYYNFIYISLPFLHQISKYIKIHQTYKDIKEQIFRLPSRHISSTHPLCLNMHKNTQWNNKISNNLFGFCWDFSSTFSVVLQFFIISPFVGWYI